MNNVNRPELSRRSFLVGSAGTGLLMGFGAVLPGCSPEDSATESAVTQLEKQLFSPTVWFEMSETGATKINIAKAEMGQHVGTALARIVAEELGVAWSDVSIHHVDTDPKWGYMITGGSWSVFTTFKQLSQAGAAGRIALIDAGAKLLGVSPADCTAERSTVRAGDTAVSFAEIVQTGELDRVFSAEELEALPLKPAADRQLLGHDVASLDVPEKTRGAAVYGIDSARPGMLYASPLIPPTRYGSSVESVDDAAARDIPGYVQYEVLNDPSETLQGWVAVVAENYWSAQKAANAIKVVWKPGPTAAVGEAEIIGEGRKLAADKAMGALLVDDGNVGTARSEADRNISATYTTATALHFALEPANAIAEFADGKWHFYSGNQWQSLILPVLAAALEVEETDLVIHQYYLGGGFGRRLFGDYIVPAALTAKAIGKPVKMVFTREQDCRFDCVRSASVQQFDASVDSKGAVSGIEHAAAAGWPTLTMAPGFLGDGLNDSGKIDGFSISGADHWYTLPSHRVRALNNDLAQRTFLPGWLRAVGPGWTTWGVESFMDELAAAQGADAVDFRLSLLDASGKNSGSDPESVSGAARLANVLERVRKKSGWGRELPRGKGQGVAVGSGQERTMPTWVACVADVDVDAASGAVKVERLTMVIDCGTIVHPDGALAQAEGAALWGVSLALHEGTEIRDGEVADLNLDTYTPLRMADVPELDIEFVASTEFPVGLGEPPLSVVPPAIGNAIFAAVGVRARHLPIRPDVVRSGNDSA